MEKELKMKLKMQFQTARRYFYRKRKAVGDCFKLTCTLWRISFQTLAFDLLIQNVKNGDWSIKNLDWITKSRVFGKVKEFLSKARFLYYIHKTCRLLVT